MSYTQDSQVKDLDIAEFLGTKNLYLSEVVSDGRGYKFHYFGQNEEYRSGIYGNKNEAISGLNLAIARSLIYSSPHSVILTSADAPEKRVKRTVVGQSELNVARFGVNTGMDLYSIVQGGFSWLVQELPGDLAFYKELDGNARPILS